MPGTLLPNNVYEGDSCDIAAANDFLHPEKLKALGRTRNDFTLYPMMGDSTWFLWELRTPSYNSGPSLPAPYLGDGYGRIKLQEKMSGQWLKFT